MGEESRVKQGVMEWIEEGQVYTYKPSIGRKR
jgi:hypothetical protein